MLINLINSWRLVFIVDINIIQKHCTSFLTKITVEHNLWMTPNQLEDISIVWTNENILTIWLGVTCALIRKCHFPKKILYISQKAETLQNWGLGRGWKCKPSLSAKCCSLYSDRIPIDIKRELCLCKGFRLGLFGTTLTPERTFS